MSKSRATIVLVTGLGLALATPVFAASPGSPDSPAKTTPQGEDPPGADNGDQAIPPNVEHKGVIAPPPTGDTGIDVQVPNPGVGTPGEVIPPLSLQGEPR